MKWHKDFAAMWHVVAVLGQPWQCSTADSLLSSLLAPGLLPGDQLLFVDMWTAKCRESSGT